MTIFTFFKFVSIFRRGRNEIRASILMYTRNIPSAELTFSVFFFRFWSPKADILMGQKLCQILEGLDRLIVHLFKTISGEDKTFRRAQTSFSV